MKQAMKLAGVLLLVGTLSVHAQKKEINVSQSVVHWTGNKIGGSHNGDIQIKNGYLDFKNGEIIGGKVVMDMKTISNSDLEDEGYNQKLVGHLKSDDFFGVETYPTATFEVTKAGKFKDGKATLSGLITIKGKTETISFEVYKKEGSYKTQLKIDRSKFNVRYGSNSFFDNLGDKAIDDVFILDIKLVMQ
jgi:polyisoprenoid-binding protein YceI